MSLKTFAITFYIWKYTLWFNTLSLIFMWTHERNSWYKNLSHLTEKSTPHLCVVRSRDIFVLGGKRKETPVIEYNYLNHNPLNIMIACRVSVLLQTGTSWWPILETTVSRFTSICSRWSASWSSWRLRIIKTLHLQMSLVVQHPCHPFHHPPPSWRRRGGRFQETRSSRIPSSRRS